MDEASKTRNLWGESVLSLMKGTGIDIGCGRDPVLPSVERFDQKDGDADRIRDYVKKEYDFVFSSHCLEHMKDPHRAIREWFHLVKPGGHLIALVPDEDLYEQGLFPSLFNPDHKFTFTVAKARSWSPRSINILDLVRQLPGELVSVELQDQGYDRKLQRHSPGWFRRYLYKVMNRVRRWNESSPAFQARVTRLFFRLGAVVDQTTLPDARMAQIQFIVRKKSGGVSS